MSEDIGLQDVLMIEFIIIEYLKLSYLQIITFSESFLALGALVYLPLF